MKVLKKLKQGYKITEVEKEPERFMVNAKFYENDKKVGEIKHGLPLDMSVKEIEEEVAKACALFFQERDRAEKNKEKDELDKVAQDKIDKLNGKENLI